jgi:hypothetical protein
MENARFRSAFGRLRPCKRDGGFEPGWHGFKSRRPRLHWLRLVARFIAAEAPSYPDLPTKPQSRFRRPGRVAAFIICEAFDGAWALLQSVGSDLTEASRSLATRTILAKRIIDMAYQGMTDATELRDDALAFLQRDPPSG